MNISDPDNHANSYNATAASSSEGHFEPEDDVAEGTEQNTDLSGKTTANSMPDVRPECRAAEDDRHMDDMASKRAGAVKPAQFDQVIDGSGLPTQSAPEPNQTDFCTPRSTGLADLKGKARFEAWLETLVSRSPFFQKLLAFVYLPLSFHSGLKMKKIDKSTFTYVLPFRRFNKNWYKAMAGAALVANSEIAAGLFLMNELKGRWTVVCRQMNYRFLRPCFGPAVYKIQPEGDLNQQMALGKEFNVNLVIDILQQVKSPSLKRQPRVGRCTMTFHITPKGSDGNSHFKNRHIFNLGKRKKQQSIKTDPAELQKTTS